MNYDPSVMQSYGTIVNNIWRTSIMPRYFGSMTNAESARVQNDFNQQINNICSQLIATQNQRGYPLSQQEVGIYLENYIKALITNIRQQNQYGAFSNNIPINGFGMPQNNFGMMPSAFNPGFGMNRPMGYNPGFSMPQNNFGMNPMGMPQPAPVTGQMPSATTMQMANMYEMKPSQPPMQTPMQNVGMMPQPQVQKPVPQPVMDTMPSTKITADIQQYTEPICSKTTEIKEDNPYGIKKGTIREYIDQENKKLVVAQVEMKRWVKSVHSTVADLVESLKPNFLRVIYKRYKLTDIPIKDLKTCMSKIKTALQKALADKKDYSSFEMLELVMTILNKEVMGISNFVTELITTRFNQFMYTKNVGNGAYMADSIGKILSFRDTVKDATIMKSIDDALFLIIDTVLANTVIYDPASAEVESYLSNDVVDGDKTYANLKKDAEAFKKWAAEHSVVVTDDKTTIWTDLKFADMAYTGVDDLTVISKPRIMDDSPIDADIEYFVKNLCTDVPLCNVIINIVNVCVNYMMAKSATEIHMREAGMF